MPAVARTLGSAPRCSFSKSAPPRRHYWLGLRDLSICSSKTSFSTTCHQSLLLSSNTTHCRTFPQPRNQFSTTSTCKMSFSNTDVHADPYKEKNKDEPGTEQKISDLVSFIKASKFGMMTTRSVEGGLLVSRCMALAASEKGGIDLIFHTNTESGKTDDLEKDPNINMSFLNGTGEWASVSGKASIITDRAVVSKYYSPELKTWLGDLGDGKHDGSENDPRIGVIKIEAKTATYALSRSNFLSRGIEMVQGAITGNAAQVNKLREISENEISQWRSSH